MCSSFCATAADAADAIDVVVVVVSMNARISSSKICFVMHKGMGMCKCVCNKDNKLKEKNAILVIESHVRN